MDGSRAFRQHLERNPQRDDVSAMLYLDTKIWLPDNLLMKGDKMTMAASLEARMPLLDASLIEYAASIPSDLKVKPLRAKYLFKRAYADFLPEPILTRKKMGFNVPISAWFGGPQHEMLRQLLLSERARSRGLFDMAFVERLVDDHLMERVNYGMQLFHLASLELWFRVFVDPPQLTAPAADMATLLAPDAADPIQVSAR
jgi:asparagine synthase (glutamine-hydrolysing)